LKQMKPQTVMGCACANVNDCRENSNVSIRLQSKLKCIYIRLQSKLKCIYMIAERTQIYVEGCRETSQLQLEVVDLHDSCVSSNQTNTKMVYMRSRSTHKVDTITFIMNDSNQKLFPPPWRVL
jgi:hypothetical protein